MTKQAVLFVVCLFFYLSGNATERVMALSCASQTADNPYHHNLLQAEFPSFIESLPDDSKEVKSAWAIATWLGRLAAYQYRLNCGGGGSDRSAEFERVKRAVKIVLELEKNGQWWWPGSKVIGDANANRMILYEVLEVVQWILAEDPAWIKDSNIVDSLRRAIEFQLHTYGADGPGTEGAIFRGVFANQDVVFAGILRLAARTLKIQSYEAIASKAISRLFASQLPNGAFRYIGDETPSPSYDAFIAILLQRYIQYGTDRRAETILERSGSYWVDALSDYGVAEYWSSPWWKQNWYRIPATSIDIIAAHSSIDSLAMVAERIRGNTRRAVKPSLDDVAAALVWQKEAPRSKKPETLRIVRDETINSAKIRYSNWLAGVTIGSGFRSTFIGVMEGQDFDNFAAIGGVGIASADRSLFLSGGDDVFSIETTRRLISACVSSGLYPKSVTWPRPPRQLAKSNIQIEQVWQIGFQNLVGVIRPAKNVRNSKLQLEFKLIANDVVYSDSDSTIKAGRLFIRVFNLVSKPVVEQLAPISGQEKPVWSVRYALEAWENNSDWIGVAAVVGGHSVPDAVDVRDHSIFVRRRAEGEQQVLNFDFRDAHQAGGCSIEYPANLRP